MKVATQGERLKELMDFFELSQADFAKRFNIPKGSLSMYVSDSRNMKQNRIKQIADSFKIDEAWLLGYDVPMVYHKELPPEIQKQLDEQLHQQYVTYTHDFVKDNFSNETYKLLTLFEKLNEEGQERLLQYANDLVDTNKYIKNNESELVEKTE